MRLDEHRLDPRPAGGRVYPKCWWRLAARAGLDLPGPQGVAGVAGGPWQPGGMAQRGLRACGPGDLRGPRAPAGTGINLGFSPILLSALPTANRQQGDAYIVSGRRANMLYVWDAQGVVNLDQCRRASGPLQALRGSSWPCGYRLGPAGCLASFVPAGAAGHRASRACRSCWRRWQRLAARTGWFVGTGARRWLQICGAHSLVIVIFTPSLGEVYQLGAAPSGVAGGRFFPQIGSSYQGGYLRRA